MERSSSSEKYHMSEENMTKTADITRRLSENKQEVGPSSRLDKKPEYSEIDLAKARQEKSKEI